MFCFTLFVVVLFAAVGAFIALIWLRVTEHMRNNPEAAKLVAEHVIAPILTGYQRSKSEEKPEAEPEPKRNKDTLV